MIVTRPFPIRLAGYFIGDGHCAGGSITCADKDQGRDIVYCTHKLGFEITTVTKLGNKALSYNLKSGVRDWLKENNQQV